MHFDLAVSILRWPQWHDNHQLIKNFYQNIIWPIAGKRHSSMISVAMVNWSQSLEDDTDITLTKQLTWTI